MTDNRLALSIEDGSDHSTSEFESEYVVWKIPDDLNEEERDLLDYFDVEDDTLSDLNDVGPNTEEVPTALALVFSNKIKRMDEITDIYLRYSDQSITFWVVSNEEGLNVREEIYMMQYEVEDIFPSKNILTHVVVEETDPELTQIPDDAILIYER